MAENYTTLNYGNYGKEGVMFPEEEGKIDLPALFDLLWKLLKQSSEETSGTYYYKSGIEFKSNSLGTSGLRALQATLKSTGISFEFKVSNKKQFIRNKFSISHVRMPVTSLKIQALKTNQTITLPKNFKEKFNKNLELEKIPKIKELRDLKENLIDYINRHSNAKSNERRLLFKGVNRNQKNEIAMELLKAIEKFFTDVRAGKSNEHGIDEIQSKLKEALDKNHKENIKSIYPFKKGELSNYIENTLAKLTVKSTDKIRYK